MIRKSALCTCLLLGAAMAAMAQSAQENLAKCKSTAPDVRIAGCTALIQPGLLTPENRSVIYLYRGNAYEEKGDHDHAIQDFNEAIHLNSNDERAVYSRGFAYKKKGDYDRAIQDFNEAIRLNPSFERAYFDRGNAYIDNDDYGRAIQEFDEAIRLKPNDAFAYNDRGVAYLRKDDHGNAIQDFSQAILLKPDYTSAYGSRGFAYYAQSNLTAATADFMHTISAAPSSIAAVSSVLMLHVILKRQGHDDAQQLARVATAADLSKWPGAVLKLDLGQMTAHEVMTAAAIPDPDKPKKWLAWQVCEAYYFTGEEAILQHQRTTALARLKAARDGCPKGDPFYALALAELKRLGAWPAPEK